MTLSEKQAWEKVRAKGRDSFVVRVGLLRYGLKFGIIWGLFKIVSICFFKPTFQPAISVIASWGFMCVGFGALMGFHQWQQNERDYEKPTEEEHES